MNLEKLYFESSTELLLTLRPDFTIDNASDLFLEFIDNAHSTISGAPLTSFILAEEAPLLDKFLSYGRIGEKQQFHWIVDNGETKALRFKLSTRSAYGIIIKLEDPGALNNKWGKKLMNEQILQLLLNLVPFPLFVKNSACEYVLLNQAQADLFGLLKAEMIGKTDEDFVKDKKELETVVQSDKEVMSSFKKMILPEQQFSTPNGKMYILETIKVPFINEVTGETNILGVSIDITERKLAEAMLKKNHIERQQMLQKLSQHSQAFLQPLMELLETLKTDNQTGKANLRKELETSITEMNQLMEEMIYHAKN